ncbi:folate-binding protein YgfZ [Cutibacterium sp.]|uniref:CAF17-like 4Fe-4S cluster assembly/insertion protein YgfZ n=1 Tax=Cutibacterium sp. TaxID=1912221 RepID=UPI0026DB9312|nr:folate-binding protein [Cutibacterium sp.]MDO4412829.1 folate-binding protein [Cutibacterium sp.]
MADPVVLTDGPDVGLVSHVGNPVAEQRIMSDGGGWVELSNREVFTVTGLDRLGWLHSLTSQYLEGLEAGRTTTSLVLSPSGHIEHVIHGVDDGETFWGWTEPGRGSDLVAWLDSMRFMLRVEVALRPDLTVRWLGSKVATPVGAVVLDSEVADGHEVIIPVGVAGPDDAEQLGVLAWDALRIAAGIPRIGIDTDQRTIPNEIGLYGTHLNKGCYRGQETVARVYNLGRPPRRLTMLQLDGSRAQLPAVGSEVYGGGRRVGVMGSSATHHVDGPIGLALVRRSIDVTLELEIDGIAACQEPLVDPEVGLHVRPVV